MIQKKRGTSGEGLAKSVSDSSYETGRNLMTPEEVMSMRGIYADKDIPVARHRAGDTLIFVAGQPPIKAQQSLFYQDTELRRRTEMSPAAIESEHHSIAKII